MAYLANIKGAFLTKIHARSDKKSGSLGFFVEKRNNLFKKVLFFIHFHRNDPQYPSTVP